MLERLLLLTASAVSFFVGVCTAIANIASKEMFVGFLITSFMLLVIGSAGHTECASGDTRETLPDFN